MLHLMDIDEMHRQEEEKAKLRFHAALAGAELPDDFGGGVRAPVGKVPRSSAQIRAEQIREQMRAERKMMERR